MALKIVASTQFKKDLKRIKKRGLCFAELEWVLDALAQCKELPERYRDHALMGRYQGFRECHIQPNLLLIYAIDGERLILTAVRTGTHSDLFS